MTIVEAKNGLGKIIILDPRETITDDKKWDANYVFGRTINGELEVLKCRYPILNYPDKFKRL